MSNKIDAYNSITPRVATATTAKSAVAGSTSGSTAAKAAPVAAADTVRLTGDAHQLQQLEKTIAAIPLVDHTRVQRVRDALRDGSYQINPQLIAAKLLRTEWDLARG